MVAKEGVADRLEEGEDWTKEERKEEDEAEEEEAALDASRRGAAEAKDRVTPVKSMMSTEIRERRLKADWETVLWFGRRKRAGEGGELKEHRNRTRSPSSRIGRRRPRTTFFNPSLFSQHAHQRSGLHSS